MVAQVCLKGFYIFLEGEEVSTDVFRSRCLVPLCGTRKSRKVLQEVMYQIAICNECAMARERLQYQSSEGFNYLEFNRDGIYLLLSCRYNDNVCDVHVIEYAKKAPTPP